VKIWKNIGMGIRSKSGEWLLPDHPAFRPIFEAIERAGRTVIAHLADLDEAWNAPDPNNPSDGYYRTHPEWRMYQRPGAPAKEEILAARDRVLSRHPKLRMIGCHIGSNEQDLTRAARRLDAHPNFVMDLAARVRILMRQDPKTVREFVLKYA